MTRREIAAELRYIRETYPQMIPDEHRALDRAADALEADEPTDAERKAILSQMAREAYDAGMYDIDYGITDAEDYKITDTEESK